MSATDAINRLSAVADAHPEWTTTRVTHQGSVTLFNPPTHVIRQEIERHQQAIRDQSALAAKRDADVLAKGRNLQYELLPVIHSLNEVAMQQAQLIGDNGDQARSELGKLNGQHYSLMCQQADIRSRHTGGTVPVSAWAPTSARQATGSHCHVCTAVRASGLPRKEDDSSDDDGLDINF